MRTMIRLTMAAAAIALGAAAIQPAHAADMLVPQAQAPAPAYYPPPAQAYAYPPPPPPVAYYAPPPVAYYAPAYAVWPGPGRNLITRAGAIGAATARASPTATDRVFDMATLVMADMATGAAAGIAELQCVSGPHPAASRPPSPARGRGKKSRRTLSTAWLRRTVGKREPNASQTPSVLSITSLFQKRTTRQPERVRKLVRSAS